MRSFFIAALCGILSPSLGSLEDRLAAPKHHRRTIKAAKLFQVFYYCQVLQLLLCVTKGKSGADSNRVPRGCRCVENRV